VRGVVGEWIHRVKRKLAVVDNESKKLTGISALGLLWALMGLVLGVTLLGAVVGFLGWALFVNFRGQYVLVLLAAVLVAAARRRWTGWRRKRPT